MCGLIRNLVQIDDVPTSNLKRVRKIEHNVHGKGELEAKNLSMARMFETTELLCLDVEVCVQWYSSWLQAVPWVTARDRTWRVTELDYASQDEERICEHR